MAIIRGLKKFTQTPQDCQLIKNVFGSLEGEDIFFCRKGSKDLIKHSHKCPNRIMNCIVLYSFSFKIRSKENYN